MDNTLIWIITFLVEACLLSSGILGFLLWRSRRVQRRLRAEVEALQHAQKKHADTGEISAPVPNTEELPPLKQDQNKEDEAIATHIVKTIHINEAMEQSIDQLQEKNEKLEKWIDTLAMHLTEEKMSQQKAPLLQHMLLEARGELATLRQINTYLQQQQQENGTLLRRSADELRVSARQRALLQATIRELQATNTQLVTQNTANKDKFLEEFQVKMSEQPETSKDEKYRTLKQEISQLKTQLAEREADYHRLQKDYSVLSIEYRELFESFQNR